MLDFKQLIQAGKSRGQDNDFLKRLDKELQRLEANGELYPPPAAPVYACTFCEDIGFIKAEVKSIDDPLFGKLIPCPKCQKGTDHLVEQWRSRLNQTKLPPQYLGMTFETFEALPEEYQQGKKQAYHAAKAFTDSASHYVSMQYVYGLAGREWLGYDRVRNSLVFQGSYGVGKTGMAACIVNAFAARGIPILYTRVQDFIMSVQARYGQEEPPSAEDVIDTVRQANILVLDEFNLDIKSENRREIMENVIRYRHGHALPTIVTCNADEAQLQAAWGDRTIEALLEMAHFIRMGGLSLRDKCQPPESEVF